MKGFVGRAACVACGVAWRCVVVRACIRAWRRWVACMVCVRGVRGLRACVSLPESKGHLLCPDPATQNFPFMPGCQISLSHSRKANLQKVTSCLARSQLTFASPFKQKKKQLAEISNSGVQVRKTFPLHTACKEGNPDCFSNDPCKGPNILESVAQKQKLACFP